MTESEDAALGGDPCALQSGDHRCARQDCPDRVNPLESLVNSMEGLATDFEAAQAALDDSLNMVKADLNTPSSTSWHTMLPTVAGVLSYVGVFGFVMAHAYLRAYNAGLVGGVPLSYGYLDTFVGAWSTLLSATLWLAPMLVYWAGLSGALSVKTRSALTSVFREASRLQGKARDVRDRYEEWKPIIESAAQEPWQGPDADEQASPEEVSRTLERLGRLVASMEHSAMQHRALVDQTVQLDIGTAIALRLAHNGHKHRTWAAMFAVQFLAVAGLIFFTISLSGEIAGIGRLLGSAGVYAFALVSVCCFWLMTNVADFANGPGTRSSRVAVAQIALVAMALAVSVLSALGGANAQYASNNPGDVFVVADVQLTSGEHLNGFLIPVVGTQDSFILPSRDTSSGVIRVPASQIARTTLEEPSP